MSSTMVDAINLTKTFGSLLAVDHVNINVKNSEIFGFLGPNGAGKTTTVRLYAVYFHQPLGQPKSLATIS